MAGPSRGKLFSSNSDGLAISDNHGAVALEGLGPVDSGRSAAPDCHRATVGKPASRMRAKNSAFQLGGALNAETTLGRISGVDHSAALGRPLPRMSIGRSVQNETCRQDAHRFNVPSQGRFRDDAL